MGRGQDSQQRYHSGVSDIVRATDSDDIGNLWYTKNRRPQHVRDAVKEDIKRVLASDADFQRLLQPKKTLSHAKLMQISVPKYSHTSLVIRNLPPAGADYAEWKRDQLRSERQRLEKSDRQRMNELATRRRSLQEWKEGKQRAAQAKYEMEQVSQRDRKKKAQELHKELSKSAVESIARYAREHKERLARAKERRQGKTFQSRTHGKDGVWSLQALRKDGISTIR